MKSFTFGTDSKKMIEVDRQGKMLIRDSMMGTKKYNVEDIKVIYIKDASFTKNGTVYLSFDGEPVASPELCSTGFAYSLSQKPYVERLVKLLQSIDGRIIDTKKTSTLATRERAKKEVADRNAIRCPNCQSINVEFMGNNRKAFSVGKAIGGALLTGGIGTLAGFAGKKGRDRWHCKDCGNTFER